MIRNFDCDTGSDGLHFIGYCRGVLVDGVFGTYGDDAVAWVGDDTVDGVTTVVPDSFGSLFGFDVRNVRTYSTAARQIYLGNSRASSPYTTQARDVRLSNLYAENSNAPAIAVNGIVLHDLKIDSAAWSSPIGETNSPRNPLINIGYAFATSIGELTVSDMRSAGPEGIQYGISVSTPSSGGANTVTKLTIQNSKIEFDCANGSNGLRWVTVDSSVNGNYVEELVFQNCQSTNPVGATQNYAYVWANISSAGSSAGTGIGRVTVRGGRIDGYGCIEEAQWNNNVVFDIEGLVANARWVLQGYGGYDALLNRITLLPGYNNANTLLNFTDGNGGKAINIYAKDVHNKSGNQLIGASNYGTAVLSIKSGDSTVLIDITKLSRSGSAGAMCVHNGGTTAGTIVSGNLVVCDTSNAANSWKQMSNLSNTY